MMEYYGNLNVSPYAQLYHHGIRRMKWGVRNGPPYPLSPTISTGSSLKKTIGSSGFTYGGLFKKKKNKSVYRADGDDSTNNEAVDEEELRREAKEKMLRKSDPREVKAHYQELTNDELNAAVSRIRSVEELNKRIPKDKTKLEKLDDLTKKINTVSNFTKATVDLYKNASSAYEIYKALSNKKN